MKKTLLAIVLTLALAVSCMFGLAACKNDKAIVVKEGKTTIGDVTTERTSYDLEGTVGNYYTLTATVNDETCNDVYLAVGPNTMGYGRLEQFEYYEENLKVTVFAAETVSNVVLVLEKVDAPVAPVPATYTAIELSTTIVPELDGADHVTYKLVIAKAGPYKVSGNINLGSATQPGNIIIGKDLDEDGAVDMGNPVEIAFEDGSMLLEVGTYYVTVYAEESFTIAIVPESDKELNVGADKAETIDTLGETAVRYTLNGVKDKYYTLTAKIEGEDEPCEDVYLYLSAGKIEGYGKIEQFKFDVDDSDGHTSNVTVQLQSVKTTGEGDNIQVVELKKVVLTLVEVDGPEEVEYPEILANGVAVTVSQFGDDNTAVYVLTVGAEDAGSFSFTTNSYISVCAGSPEGDMVISVDGVSAEASETVNLTAGTYYVVVYNDTNPASVTISAV